MLLPLLCHPHCESGPVAKMTASFRRPSPDVLRLSYKVRGDVGQIVLPPATHGQRTDGLWRHTCFEMFVKPMKGEGYFEFNFSPSSSWAAYGFDRYRLGMSEIEGILPPQISMLATPQQLELHVDFSMGLLAAWPQWQLGLSAVIETQDGAQSLWALAHPPGRADFHHEHCFAVQVAASQRI